MPDLIAQGSEAEHRWRRVLVADRPFLLGRTSGAWSIPWDDHVSRRHLEGCWRQGRLFIKRLPEARNPVFYKGDEVDHAAVTPGEHFVIGGTTFTVSDDEVNLAGDERLPVTEQAFSPSYLQRVRFRNADQRIDVLSRLPQIISGATSDEELFVRLVNVLLIGIPRALAVALVAVGPQQQASGAAAADNANDADAADNVTVLHWDRRPGVGGAFTPSGRLIREAVAGRESVVHVWSAGGQQGSPAFTQSENVDWAFCTSLAGDACRGWAIYVAGSFAAEDIRGSWVGDPDELQDDLKFAEVAALTLSSLRQARLLERSHAGLRQFFSPVVLEALEGQDPEEVLAPREAEVSVLFCDLRGFSRRSEQAADDLFGLLQRVSGALGVTTHQILEQGGVVGDFHGDSAMGFWGWPLGQEDAPERACQAALGIRDEFETAAQREDQSLKDFRMGIGIATGPVVAGKIGTVDQVKVTVFGPVVNLASRLEGMTKNLRAPILLDETTARLVRERVPLELFRVRRVARVRPYGMAQAVEVSELLPSEADYPQLTNEHIAAYESALDALLEGDWAHAFQWLHKVPVDDRVKDFLTVFIAQHNRTPPDDWDGVIPLASK